MAPYMSIKKETVSDMANAELWSMLILAKRKTLIFSLTPKPPMEIGNKVIAPIIGKKIKK
jgi:hypothetical protein